MEIIVFLSIVIAVGAVLTSIVLVRRVKKQIAEMTDGSQYSHNSNHNGQEYDNFHADYTSLLNR